MLWYFNKPSACPLKDTLVYLDITSFTVIQYLLVQTQHNSGGGGTSIPPIFPLKLSHLPLLEELTIHASVCIDQFTFYTPSLPLIANLLLTTGHPSTLKYLSFYLDFDIRHSLYLRTIDWTPLVLAIITCIQTLHRIKVRIGNPKSIDNIPSADILSTLEDHKTLTDLVERGLLVMMAE